MKKSKQAKKRTGKKRSLLIYQKLVNQWKKLSVKQRVLLSLAAFVILSITAYFSYAWYQGYAFRKVEKKLDALTQEIITELGEPISQTKEQSCGYASAKFSRGRLGCGSIYHSVYSLENQTLHQIIDKVRSVIRKNSNFKLLTQGGFDYFDVGGTSDTIYDSMVTNCSAAYEYSSRENDISPNNLKVYVFCSTHPLRPFYSVKE